jgi:CheY-like chemotaxis protein
MGFPLDPIPTWRHLYDQMCGESDTNKLTELVAQFEEAIFDRGQEINDDAEHLAEREAMTHATKDLIRIQTEVLGWPDVVTSRPERGDRAMLVAVLIADDRELLRNAIRKVLDHDPEIRIVGEAENFPQTVALTRELHPRVVVMDLHMPAPDDFSHRDVKRALNETGSKLITMSVWQDDASRALAASYGAFTFLDKSNLGQLLIPAIRQLTLPEPAR